LVVDHDVGRRRLQATGQTAGQRSRHRLEEQEQENEQRHSKGEEGKPTERPADLLERYEHVGGLLTGVAHRSSWMGGASYSVARRVPTLDVGSQH
jgi:hypothetical protein